MDGIEKLKVRVDALEQQQQAIAEMVKTIGDIEAAVCGNSSTAMNQESLIQIVKRHDLELKELSPLRKGLYAIAFIIAIPAPIVYLLAHYFVSNYAGGK